MIPCTAGASRFLLLVLYMPNQFNKAFANRGYGVWEISVMATAMRHQCETLALKNKTLGHILELIVPIHVIIYVQFLCPCGHVCVCVRAFCFKGNGFRLHCVNNSYFLLKLWLYRLGHEFP